MQRRTMISAGISRAPFFIFAFLVCSLSPACGDAEHRAALEELVRNNAKEKDVIAKLGTDVAVYQRGTANWSELEKFLAREPASNLSPLRRGVEKYPRILYYTTAWRMTWIFLDQNGVVRDYYVSAQ